jgi:superfamily II DNA or RNA helicase
MTPLFRKEEIKRRLKEIDKERNALLQELDTLSSDQESPPFAPLLGSIISESPPATSEERIALFTRLFRCREDVFPKLWENRIKGTRGYSPACQVEWVKGLCEKPKIKCSECVNRVFVPLDQTIIRSHLEGTITIGSYAIREDDTCTFLAADFDKEQWQPDVLAYKDASKKLGIETYIERSRSGNGAHAWLFFKEPILARLARQLGTILLFRAIGERYHRSFKSYDRFFPSQDTLPNGGFGNLIALPLQRAPRKVGNSVFIDDNFNPWPDQWAFLSQIRLLSIHEVVNFINACSKKPGGSILNESADPEIALADRLIPSESESAISFFGEIFISIYNNIQITLEGIPSRLIAAYKRLATFANPKFFELQRLRFSTWKTPRYICCAELSEDEKKFLMPRGLLSHCIKVSESAGARITISDQRPQYKRISIKFTGKLLLPQKDALRALMKNESGILVAPPGAGKTVIGCTLICKYKLPTLILVHRKQLADQWKDRLLEFTDIKKKQIGIYDLKGEKQKGIIDIGMFQTLAHIDDWSRLITEYGLIIVDECHRVPAPSFEPVLKRIVARHYLGLTATPYRKDGLDRIITMQCGPILHTMTESAAQKELSRNVIVRETSFRMSESENIRSELHEIWQAMITDAARTTMIASDIGEALSEGRFPLVLSDRKEYLENIARRVAEMIGDESANGFVITSENGKKERARFIEEARKLHSKGKQAFLLSTGSLIGEGFDLPELCTLMLAMPLSFKGRLVQYAGRLHRESAGKKDIRIYDYVDGNLGLGITMFRKRLTTYRKMGYSISMPSESKLKSGGKNEDHDPRLDL